MGRRHAVDKREAVKAGGRRVPVDSHGSHLRILPRGPSKYRDSADASWENYHELPPPVPARFATGRFGRRAPHSSRKCRRRMAAYLAGRVKDGQRAESARGSRGLSTARWTGTTTPTRRTNTITRESRFLRKKAESTPT